MFFRLMIYAAFMNFIAGPVLADNVRSLDFSRLPYDSAEVELIKQFMPGDFKQSLERKGVTPQEVVAYIGTRYFYENKMDSVPKAYLLYYTDGISRGKLMAVSIDDEKPEVIAETDAVLGCVQMTVAMIDIDCDNNNEIMVSTITGSKKYQAIDILRLKKNGFHFITPKDPENRFIARMYDLNDIDGDCIKEAAVFFDGPTPRQFGVRKLYRYNGDAEKYEFESRQDR